MSKIDHQNFFLSLIPPQQELIDYCVLIREGDINVIELTNQLATLNLVIDKMREKAGLPTKYTGMTEIPKHPRHDHFWIENGVLYETYTTIRGLRYQSVIKIGDYADEKKCRADTLTSIFNKFYKPFTYKP